jgi:ABC-type dipeptide/oligopeptide/nickel transport system ATPase component
MDELIKVGGLRTHFQTKRGVARVLDGLDLTLSRGEVTGLVGESGSGKSVMAYSIMRLVRPPGQIVGGTVQFQGRDLLQLPEAEMARVRGREISIIFQQPRSSLNPVFTVGDILLNVLKVHRGLRGKAGRQAAHGILARVGLPDPVGIMKRYPHEMSGGMCQRIMIALAVSSGPQLLIADEPTTALDVTVQLQIVQLLQELKERDGLTQLLITHDLGLVAELCDQVAVMYAGEIVEQSPVSMLFDRPSHPYTRGLLASRPKAGTGGKRHSIPGQVPSHGTSCLRRAGPGYRAG